MNSAANAQNTHGPGPGVLATSTTDISVRMASSLTTQAVTVSTLDGRYITGAVADFAGTPLRWTATLSHLDQPGYVAMLFFAEGVREVVVRLEDGRRARARMTGTNVLAGAQRVCSVEGVERLV